MQLNTLMGEKQNTRCTQLHKAYLFPPFKHNWLSASILKSLVYCKSYWFGRICPIQTILLYRNYSKYCPYIPLDLQLAISWFPRILILRIQCRAPASSARNAILSLLPRALIPRWCSKSQRRPILTSLPRDHRSEISPYLHLSSEQTDIHTFGWVLSPTRIIFPRIPVVVSSWDEHRWQG